MSWRREWSAVSKLLDDSVRLRLNSVRLGGEGGIMSLRAASEESKRSPMRGVGSEEVVSGR